MNKLQVGGVIVGLSLTLVVPASALPLSEDETPITISGCIAKGKNGGYVLTDVFEHTTSAGAVTSTTTPGAALFYWLDDSKKLKDYVGRRALISGEVEGELDRGKVTLERTDAGIIEMDLEYRGRKVIAQLSDVPVSVAAALSTSPSPAVVASANAGVTGAVGTSGTTGAVGTSGSAAPVIGDEEIAVGYRVRKVDVKSVQSASGSCR